MNAAELRARGVPRGNPEELRILDKPGDTAWLAGPNRRMFLRQAASLSYGETGRLDGVDRIIGGLSDPVEVDDVLCYVAEMAATPGAMGNSLALWKRVKSTRRAIVSACTIARQIGRRSEDAW